LLPGPSKIVGSGEAINGAAFTEKLVAVSNRSELVVQRLIPGIGPDVLEGGAHEVIASELGRIIAPRGGEGLLIISPSENGRFTSTTLRASGADPYFYKTVQVGPGENGREWFASACRDEGIALLHLDAGQDRGDFTVMSKRNPRTGEGADIVSLCPLNRPGYPYALAFLAMDGTVYFTADVRTSEFKGVAFDKLEGTPYTILGAQGHLFILTSEKLHFLKGFADRAIRDDLDLARDPIRTISLGVDAVECSIVDDEYLLLIFDSYLTVNLVSDLFGDGRDRRTETQEFQSSDMMATLIGAA
jgi:hypothetical protein